MRCVLGFLTILSLSIFSQEEEIIVIAERGWVFTPSVDNLSEEDINEINAHPVSYTHLTLPTRTVV